jgi:hypothetical protein
MAGIPFDSCTGRAISARDDQPAAGRVMMLIAGPHCWPSAERAAAAITKRGPWVVIASGLEEIVYFSLIKTGIVPVCLDLKSVAALQDAVESDPGILLTVDVARREVRARTGLVARFDIADADQTARRLLMARRLIGSGILDDGARMRMQRRLVAIGDALKVPGGDAARGASRLDRLLTDIAQAVRPGRPRRAS